MSPRDLVINNLGMIGLALLWGTMIPSLVVLLEIWDPFFVAAVRYALAIVPFLLLLRIVERGPILPAGVPLWRLLVLGLVGYGIFSPMFSIGLAHTHPLTAVIIVAMAPIVGSIVGRVMFQIPFDKRLIPAIVLAVSGAALATYDPNAEGIPFALTGSELLLIGAMCCWNWYSLAAQRWLTGYSQLRITALTASSGGILLTFIWLGAGAIGVAEFPPAVPRDSDIMLVVWIILGCIIGGILLWNWGVKKFGIVVPNLYMNLVPIVAIGLSAAIGYVPTTLQLAGGALVVGGILVSQLARLVGSKQAQATQTEGDRA
jgi:drug/metabolite transporter (DMT)-like permease